MHVQGQAYWEGPTYNNAEADCAAHYVFASMAGYEESGYICWGIALNQIGDCYDYWA